LSSVVIAAAVGMLVTGCSPIPPPDVLTELDQVRDANAARAAKSEAPAAFAHAEKLRAEAQAAFDAEDFSGAQIIGERALAAYEEAVALARLARAEKLKVQAAAEAEAAERRLAELEVAHQQVAADIAAAEQRLKVLHSLEPIAASGPAKANREKARAQVVAALRLQARLLCGAAQLLAQSRKAEGSFVAPAELCEARAALTALDALIAQGPAAAPIDGAARARAGCLRALTLVRRAGQDTKRATGGGDALLAALSEAGIGKVQRDDRGVVVTLRGVFKGDEISAVARKNMLALADMAKPHGTMPLLVVVHQAQQPDSALRARIESRGGKVLAALRKQLADGRVGRVEVAGIAAPVVDPAGKHKERNRRVDIVFVTRQAL